jgi:hypothetical protein
MGGELCHKFQTQTWTTGSRTQMRLPFSCRASMYLATTPSGVAPAGRSSCESSPNVLTFAAECIKVLHGAYAAGKAYPKSQVLEAEAAASCQARHAPPPHARHPFHRL